jgi:uncharacterized protein
VRRAAPAFLLLALPALGCPAKEGAPRTAARVLVEATPGAVAVRVEVARTPVARERGLMNRALLDPDAGMLFLFDEAALHGFWMKNTLIPLDLLFLAEDGRVAAVVERRPLSLEVTDGGVESRFVLEVNGGWAREHGVRPGDRVRFENVLW